MTAFNRLPATVQDCLQTIQQEDVRASPLPQVGALTPTTVGARSTAEPHFGKRRERVTATSQPHPQFLSSCFHWSLDLLLDYDMHPSIEFLAAPLRWTVAARSIFGQFAPDLLFGSMWRAAAQRPVNMRMADGTYQYQREELLARRGLKALHERAAWLGIEVLVERDDAPWGAYGTRTAFRLRMRHARLGMILDARRIFPGDMQQRMLGAHEQLDSLLFDVYPHGVTFHSWSQITDDTPALEYHAHPSLLLDPPPPPAATDLVSPRHLSFRTTLERTFDASFNACAQVIISASAVPGAEIAFDLEGEAGFELATLCCYDARNSCYVAVIEPAPYSTLRAACLNECMLLVYGDTEGDWLERQDIPCDAFLIDLQHPFDNAFLGPLWAEDGLLRDMRLPPLETAFAMSRITAGKIYVKATDGTSFFFPNRDAAGQLGPSIWRARPLLLEHVKYAVADVLVLFTIFNPTRRPPPPLLPPIELGLA
jgi:hypothetical protein